ncbi:hypothetical protein [Kitasatospora sp. NPDC093558]|uniref:wHTH domain-containing protein n=1 Tax=Kitasatospora sp. NPDC093558 TaxID=3155201 RepID=UPI0034342984
MLADEIEVTTCRMNPDSRLGPVLEAAICGPRHLFRIVEREAQGRQPGTTVRLYLREDVGLGEEWSCLTVLERVLGIAEFTTTVRDGRRENVWNAGVPKFPPPRFAAAFGRDAVGTAVWAGAPAGAQVIWCHSAGAVLVDGLLVEAEPARGVLSRQGRLWGAVVNLSGAFAPRRLSVDRRRILGDVSGVLEGLLAEAAKELVHSRSELPGFEWLGSVAERNPRLSDLVAIEIIRSGRRLEYGGVEFGASRGGCFPPDPHVLPGSTARERGRYGLIHPMAENPPDEVLLWRLLAHRPNAALEQLSVVCPELRGVREVRPALPSDADFFARRESTRWRWRRAVTRRWLEELGTYLGLTLEDAVVRAAELRVILLDHRGVARALAADSSRLGLLDGNGLGEFLETDRPVTVTDLVTTAEGARLDIPAVIALMKSLGLRVPQPVGALALAAENDRLLRAAIRPRGGAPYWVGPGGTVPAGNLAMASLWAGRPVSEVSGYIEAHGLKTDADHLPEVPSNETIEFLKLEYGGDERWLPRTEVIPPAHLLLTAGTTGLPLREVVRRMRGLGFEIPPLPADAGPEDLELLAGNPDVLLRPPGPVDYQHLLDGATRQRSLASVIDRYRAYGFDIPLRYPESPSRLDREVFTIDGPLRWEGLPTDGTVPYARLAEAADQLRMNRSELLRHLESRGLTVSCRRIPAGIPLGRGPEVLRMAREWEQSPEACGRAGLTILLDLADHTGAPITQVASWLRELGAPVPDLADTIWAALRRVPMADPSL